MNSRWILSIFASTALVACDVKQDRFGRTAEPSKVQEPLTIKDVSFHIRMGLLDSELVAQATKRGLVVDGDPKQALTEVRASAALIAQLTTREILLTKAERKLYEERLATRNSTQAADSTNAQEFLDQRKADLNQSLAEQRRTRARQRMAELSEKINAIRREQSREKYSMSSNSPYQQRQAEINQINREISALREQMK